ncbi:MAG: glycosyltransferase family A protein [Olegusella sp.]|nr:glycosyltransferase family A protein [Olegusella sp.]
MSTPLFSIVVPCYNVENYIEDCIGSIESQTIGDWEVVIVDDGSTDASGLIVDRMQKSHPERITVIHQSNHGQLLSRRAAFAKARGKYLVCLDADDTLRADALETLRDLYSEHPDAIIQFQLSTKPDFTAVRGPIFPETLSYPAVKDIGWLRQQVCTASDYNNLCGKAFPRDSIDLEEDLSRYAFMRNGEDVLQLVSVLDHALPVILVNECLYYYRENPGSVTHTFQQGYYPSIKEVDRVLREHAKGWGDTRLKTLLETRWANNSIGAIKNLMYSPYKPSRLADEIKVICEDANFCQSIENGFAGNASAVNAVLVRLAKRRSYKAMAALVTFARLLLA